MRLARVITREWLGTREPIWNSLIRLWHSFQRIISIGGINKSARLAFFGGKKVREERRVFPYYGNRLHEHDGRWTRRGYLRRTIIQKYAERNLVKSYVLDEDV